MAGIGFELKKLFSKKGLFAIIKAYGYAGIVCTGPMILGVILLLGVHFLAGFAQAAEQAQRLLNSMITYTLLASLSVTSLFSMVTTRYVADVLYVEEEEKVMPSFHGSIILMLGLGYLLYGLFLHFAGIELLYQAQCFLLFGELIVVWTEINYLTAVKDYKSIMFIFLAALAVAFLSGYLFICLGFPVIPSLMGCLMAGYGVMMVWYYFLLVRYFPMGEGSVWGFLKYFDKYPQLVLVGGFVNFGLFTHLVLMWFGPLGQQVQGLFYEAPEYDVPALCAFISILITTINFVTSVEVNFYPHYRNYYGLFNEGGSLLDIRQAGFEMKTVLQNELEYCFSRQMFITILFIVLGTLLLPKLPLGFNELSLGIFRTLCIGYAFYALGNSTMLMSLYFSDNNGAAFTTFLFCAGSICGTLYLINGKPQYYGYGFVIGGVLFCAAALVRLGSFLIRLEYYTLSRQPVILRERRSILTVFGERMEARYWNRRKRSGVNEEKMG